MANDNIKIFYEPVWRTSFKGETWRVRRVWAVFDPNEFVVFYGKKKKYALQKYNKWKETFKLKGSNND